MRWGIDMGFKFASFGAATVPLSKIVVDKELDMGQYPIIASVIKAPYHPQEWETEELDWGDIPAGEPIPFQGSLTPAYTWVTVKTFTAPPGDSYKWRFIIVTSTYSSTANFRITADGVELYNVSDFGQGTLTVDIVIPAGSTVAIQGYNNRDFGYGIMSSSSVQNLGIVGGAKTFDLSGKWLALGLDMKGLEATVKIQGVTMPYSDYPLYFPIAPTELTFPGGWDISQERPVIEVYK